MIVGAPRKLVRRRKQWTPYLYFLPILLFAVLFTYYPFVRTFLYSFSVVNFKGEITAFAGLDNFRYLFNNKKFYTALWNTLRLTVMFVPLNLLISLSLAMLCRKRRRVSPLYEMMFTLPMAIPMSSLALIFKLMLNPTAGIVNYALGINSGWFLDRHAAIYGILLVCLWMGVSFDFLLFLAALRNVPEQLEEAALIDGAGGIRRFFTIQLPMISPTVFFVICTNTIQCLMVAGPVMIITEGGPFRSTTTLLYMMYTSGYQSSDYSLAASLSIVTFVLTLGFTILAFSLEKKRVHYQ